MKAPADKSPETQRQAAAHEAPRQQDRSDAEVQFIDNRAETTSLRQLQEVADNSPRTQGLAQLKAMRKLIQVNQWVCRPICDPEGRVGLISTGCNKKNKSDKNECSKNCIKCFPLAIFRTCFMSCYLRDEIQLANGSHFIFLFWWIVIS